MNTQALAFPARPAALIPAAMLLNLGAGFALPTNAAWALLFYVTMPALVLWRLAQGWRPDWRDTSLMAMLALCLWSCLTLLWGRDVTGQGDGPVYWLRDGACTLVFLLGFAAASEDGNFRPRLIRVLIHAGAANAVLSILLYLAHGHGGRLPGWGVTQNPVLGAAIIDICLVLAVGEVAAGRLAWRGAAVTIVPMLLFLALSFSRTPLLAALAAACVLAVGASRKVLLAAAAVIVLAVLLLLLDHAALSAAWRNLAARGTDCHLEIWGTAWSEIVRRPLFGYGPSARLPITEAGYCPAYPSPHNLYLSLLLYSGAVGAALFAACVGLLFRRLWGAASGFAFRHGLALGLIPLVVGLSDLTQLIKGPAPIWYIFWLPMLLILTLRPESPGSRRAFFPSPPSS